MSVPSENIDESLQSAYQQDSNAALLLFGASIIIVLKGLLSPNDQMQLAWIGSGIVGILAGSWWFWHLYTSYSAATRRFQNQKPQNFLASYLVSEDFDCILLTSEASEVKLYVHRVQPKSEIQMTHLKEGNVPVTVYRESDSNGVTIATNQGLVFGHLPAADDTSAGIFKDIQKDTDR